MIDFKSEEGKEAKRLLESEYVLWLTTVGSDGTPQPRPVWFIWDNDAVLIYSKPDAAKVKHIRQRPNVAMHFNSDFKANENVVVLTGTAELVENHKPSRDVAAYMAKYTDGLGEIGMTADSFARAYSVAIRIKPERIR